MLRDTLDGVTAATWEFNRDLRNAGGVTVLARAERLRERCQAAALALPEAASVFRPAPAAASLVEAVRRLQGVLREQCGRGFRRDGPGSWADTLRAWGPYRASQIDDAIREYGAAAGRFAGAVGVKLEPKLPR